MVVVYLALMALMSGVGLLFHKLADYTISGQADALNRIAAILWSSGLISLVAGGIALAAGLWAILDLFLGLVIGSRFLTLSASRAKWVKSWYMYPYQMVGYGLTGRGSFSLTP